MAESWFSLSREDQVEALEFAAARSGRPAHLLEKDIWVVWVLSAIYESTLASKLTFKGGTSLSKVYRIIDRFSEDVDLTYDIRAIARQARAHLLPGGWLLLEHGWDQAQDVRAILQAAGFASVCSRQDLAGQWRCTGGQWADPTAPTPTQTVK